MISFHHTELFLHISFANESGCPDRYIAEKLDNLCTAVINPKDESCGQLTKKIESLERLQIVLVKKLEKIYNIVTKQKEPSKSELKNVAFKKPVVMSSWWQKTRSHSGYICCAPEYATDGNVTTFTHTEFEAYPYLYVDLESVHDIKRIEIINRSDGYYYQRTRNLKIEVGKTLGSLKHCSDYQGPGRNAEHMKFVCSERLSGRYVKVTLNNGNQPLNLSEVMVYAPSTA